MIGKALDRFIWYCVSIYVFFSWKVKFKEVKNCYDELNRRYDELFYSYSVLLIKYNALQCVKEVIPCENKLSGDDIRNILILCHPDLHTGKFKIKADSVFKKVSLLK